MKTIFSSFLNMMIPLVFLLMETGLLKAQVCDNFALDFDGDEDYVTLNTTSTPLSGNSDFTVEFWFENLAPTLPSCNPTTFFRRLFSFSSVSPSSLLVVGMCNDELRLYWEVLPFAQPPGGVIFINPPIGPGCHHLAVVRNGSSLFFYLDGNLTPFYSTTLNGALNIEQFTLGHSGAGNSFGQDWLGTMDEIRLWRVPRTAQEIRDNKDCSLSGNWTDLIVNWTLDQSNIVPGGSNAGVIVADMGIYGNNGTFHQSATGFSLMGNTSNFVCTGCAYAYILDISDIPALFPISYSSICEGEYVHFCVYNNSGTQISLPAGSMVMWESSDGIVPFGPDPDLTGYANATNALCFPIQPGILTANCSNNALGYVNRKYRARVQKKMGNQVCTFTTLESTLQICCPITNAQLNYTVLPPTPFNGTLCEGQATVNAFLTSTDPFFNTSNLSIQWLVNGLPYGNNTLSITYTGQVTAPNLCFEAIIQNCSCPLYTVKICIPVDPVPMCGTIDAMPFPSALMPDPAGGQYDYLICPGDHAAVGMVNPSDFKNCIPVWQYHYDNSPPGTWYDLGTSNSIQNTNTLPQVFPTNNSASPYIWPPGASCIIYRIECRPKTLPNSGCMPCTSNEVKICLKQPPPTPVISTTASQICKGNSATLSIPPVPGAQLYTWYCNGAVIGSGPSMTSINVMKYACYEVSVFDGCFTVTSPKFCLEVCAVVPVITCPIDNKCACLGIPITLIGCNSYNTCVTGPSPLTFQWSASNGGPGTQTGPNGCEFIHTPDPVGTLYTLTVTDPNLGCSAITTLKIEPCQ